MPKSKSKKLNETDLQNSLLNIKLALVDATGDVKERATQIVEDLLENLHSKKDDYVANFEECVQEKPIKSLALALGAGILIGKILL